MPLDLYLRFGIALGLGLLIGLQCEKDDSQRTDGMRGFALIALFGSMSALLSEAYGEWILAAAFLCLAGIIALTRYRAAGNDPGQCASGGVTTDLTALLLFAITAYLMHGDKLVAVACGGLVACLLPCKHPMHRLATRLGEKDLRTILQFWLISLVILPALPNQAYDPFEVINPFKIWLIVMLVVGIGLIAYVACKLRKVQAGTALGAILGGLISSTAITRSAARASRAAPSRSTSAALIIVIATAFSIVRVLLELYIVANELFIELLWPLTVLLGILLILIAILYRQRSEEPLTIDEPANPARLKSAIGFGLLYAIVLLIAFAAREYGGERGLYLVAMLSGLIDVDAITLASAQLLKREQIETSTGWRLIMAAILASTLFKGIAVAVLGSPVLRKRIAILYAIVIVSGLILIWHWPG